MYTGDIFTNNGKNIESVQQARAFGFRHYKVNNGSTVTSRGMSSFDVFSNGHHQADFIGFIKDISSSIFDIIDLTKMAQSKPGDGSTVPIPGSWGPVGAVAGVLVKDMKAEMDAELEMDFIREMEIAKQHGLAMVKKVLIHWGEQGHSRYFILDVSIETVKQLIKGDFNTFDDMLDANPDTAQSISILVQEKFNEQKKYNEYVVHTIFMD